MVLLFALIGCSGEPESYSFLLTLENISVPGAIVASDDSVHDVKLAPGLAIAHDASFSLFEAGEAPKYPEQESLAEDGDPVPLGGALRDVEGVYETSFIAQVAQADYGSPLVPGDQGVGNLLVPNDAFVTVLFMYGESNDIFVAATAIPAEDGGEATSLLEFTDFVMYDLGTEVNEEPGIGANQAGRQAQAGAGEAENGVITVVSGEDVAGYTYPAASAIASLSMQSIVAD